MSMKFKNNSGSKLANNVLASATGFTVLAGTGSNFPELTSDKDYFHATLVGDDGDMEIVRVTKVEGDVLTCVRAQEDTVAKDWPAGTRVENRITAEFLNQVATGDTIQFDQETIKTDADGVSAVDPSEVYGPATDSTLGVVKVDNDTIIVDEDGTLRSKSIPFDGGSLFDIYATSVYPNFPHTVSDPQSIRPTLSDSTFIKASYGFRSFSHVDDYAIVFDEPGFYSVVVQWVLQPIDSTHTNYDQAIVFYQQNADQSSPAVSATQTVEVDTDPDLSSYGRLNHNIFVRQGTKIWAELYIPFSANNTNQIKTTGFYIRIVKYPTTNEYQVSNTRYNGLWQNAQTQYTLATSSDGGSKYFAPKFNTSTTVDDGHPDFDISDDGYIKVKKSGIVYVNHEFSVTPNASADIVDGYVVLYIKRGTSDPVAVSQQSIHIHGTLFNPDGFSFNSMVPVDENDELHWKILVPSSYNATSLYSTSAVRLYYMPSITATQSDTLEHPNHGISQDAGNIAQVGSDLGVFVPPAYQTTTLKDGDNINTLLPGSYYVPADVTLAGTLPNITEINDDDYILIVYGNSSTELNDSIIQIAYNRHSMFKLKIRERRNGTYLSWTPVGAAFADELTTSRSIDLAGDATGHGSFKGDTDITINTTVTKWSGSTKYVSTAAPSGGANGDIWFQYI